MKNFNLLRKSERKSVGTTLALTVGSPSFDRRGTMLKHYAFMLLFLLGSLNVWGEEVFVELCTSWDQTLEYTTSYTHDYTINDLNGGTTTMTLGVKGVYRQGKANTYFQMNKKTGYFKNTTKLPGKITKIVTEWSAAKSPTICYFANNTQATSTDATTKVDAAKSVTYTPNNDADYYFFNIDVSSGSGSAQMTSCKVYYASSDPAKPTVSVTPENITWEGIAANAEKSEEITVTLSNIEAVMAELSGDNPTAFSIDKEYLEASGKIIVSKNTTTIGNYAATLTISDAETQTKTIALSMEVVADPEPTGTFEKFTGTIEEGDYVLVANGTTDALKNTITSDRFDCGTVEVADNKIVNPDKSVIWHIAANDA